MLSLDNIPLNEPRVWELLANGLCKGVFQLESPLGRSYSKKIKPKSIEQIADLISVIRPGSLEAYIGDKTVTQHYVDRNSGEEEVDYPHPVLEPVLKDTFGLILYQEQGMEICRLVAGFNLKQADELRKACGKKIPELMAKVKLNFMEGVVKNNIISQEVADVLFQNIEASQRYSFNRSHAIAYALLSYYCAYIKVLYTDFFFLSWLSKSHLKIDPQAELEELVTDARLGGIDIRPPDLRHLNRSFEARDKVIYFGYESVRSFGESNLEKLLMGVASVTSQLNKKQNEWSWLETLIFLSDEIVKTNFEALIGCGALDYLDVPRARMKYEYGIYQQLTEKEKEWCKNNYEGDFEDLLDRLSIPKKLGGGAANKSRTSKIQDLLITLKRPPISLEDTGNSKTESEQHYLGVAVTTTYVEDYEDIEVNCTCYMFANRKETYRNIVLGVEVLSIREHTIKRGKTLGQKMMFLVVQDETGVLKNITVFPDALETYGHLLKERAVLYLTGTRDNSFGSFNVETVSKMRSKQHNLYNETVGSEFST
jgi:DNA polymerase-3 subunit alpha